MFCSYVGVIKKNSRSSRLLVRSYTNNFYVLEVGNASARDFQRGWCGEVPSSKLTLATPRQIEAGRGSLWKPDQSKVTSSMVFHGIVSGGKTKKTVLVKYPDGCDNQHYFTYAVTFNTVSGLSKGDFIDVDIRYMSPARQDQIEAGLGHGKLRRKRRISVS